jgi:hypothetical protein
MFGV